MNNKKTIDDCMFEIFAHQEYSKASNKMRVYKTRFFKGELPLRTKIKLLNQYGYTKIQEALYEKA